MQTTHHANDDPTCTCDVFRLGCARICTHTRLVIAQLPELRRLKFPSGEVADVLSGDGTVIGHALATPHGDAVIMRNEDGTVKCSLDHHGPGCSHCREIGRLVGIPMPEDLGDTDAGDGHQGSASEDDAAAAAEDFLQGLNGTFLSLILPPNCFFLIECTLIFADIPVQPTMLSFPPPLEVKHGMDEMGKHGASVFEVCTAIEGVPPSNWLVNTCIAWLMSTLFNCWLYNDVVGKFGGGPFSVWPGPPSPSPNLSMQVR